MTDPQDLSPLPRAAPMHPRDRLLLAAFNWAGNIGGPLAVGCYIAWAIDQMPLRLAAPGMVVGLSAMTSATIYAFQKRAPTKRSYFWPITFGAIALTWAVLGWQTWMWFHPSTQAVQGYTQAQLDDAIAKAKETTAKPLQDKVDQASKDYQTLQQSIPKQIADAVAKAIAQSAQSDAPLSVDKLPTSLKLLFKGNSVDEVDSKNVLWTPLFAWRERQNLLVTQSFPAYAIIVVFKKPLVFVGVRVEDHGAGVSDPQVITDNPRYAILVFDSPMPYNTLLDITFTNDRKK
jgi:hypothetical protein